MKVGKFKFKTRKGQFDKEIILGELDRNNYQIPDAKVVVDIGSHIGGTAIYCASRGADVYAYEADRENFNLLVENVFINGLSDKIRCFNLAVGSNGKIYRHKGNSGRYGSYEPSEDFSEVKTIPLTEVINKDCDLLKLDCEGAEYDILQDIDKVHSKIKQISMELHFFGEDYKNKELERVYGKQYWFNLVHSLERFYKVDGYTSLAKSARLLICRHL